MNVALKKNIARTFIGLKIGKISFPHVYKIHDGLAKVSALLGLHFGIHAD